jgi:hypothetical protein
VIECGYNKKFYPQEEKMHITYDIKKGITYAKACKSKRNGEKVEKEYIYLGRVLDKEKGIYQNQERGVYKYEVGKNAYGEAPEEYVAKKSGRKETLILDFGDAYFLEKFIKASGIEKVIERIGYGNPDTLKAMISYYTICSMANCHAESWWEGSYARILYPKANLTSQRISNFLTAIGEEEVQRRFFGEYFALLEDRGVDIGNILIDSSGLPNSIHFPLTAIRNHNGEISNEVRLIYVVHQKTGLPIYFRYCAGNIIDTTTLVRCLEELKAQGVDVNYAILDAGYYTDDNIEELFKKGISFLTRMKANNTVYKEIVAAHFDTLDTKANLVEYNGRYVYLKCVPCELAGYSAYAYIGIDIERKSYESQKIFTRAKDKNMNTNQVFDAMKKQGLFMLVSSRRIAKSKVLPLYYTRQQIEQVFDVGKNYADLLPLRVHSEDTFRGHLLLTFIATIIIKQIQDCLLHSSITPISLFLDLRNHKCKVFPDRIITMEVFKKANDCYKLFNFPCPPVFPR